jgi:hypothetical protein
MSWFAVKTFFKKAWVFIRDQWLFFLALAAGIVAFILGIGSNKAGEFLAGNKEESNRARAEKDKDIRGNVVEFQERIIEISEDINNKEAALDAAKEQEIQEVVEDLGQELTDEELRAILKDKVPSFNYVPLSRFGEVSDD